ncbi:phosphatase PAP2 family protein [Corallococcus carmarthensis]|uniref:Phosphatase PAP2 family protein n=1 Tax=Corallococcus carmarthensis TaxID=2316728 RepID=A0A3A8KJ68_9BACT|nr:phosphatase PAP2 family protein [Corallococcus carmarthensis]NOK23488.1 phosphatase PAP2 family protein [Corallococcus carmarthensis]RKH02462.1 phosphatase PAP2 family protein [Corallococcus carmarthensis]
MLRGLRRWLSGWDVMVTRPLGLLLLVAACVLGFVYLSDEVHEGETQDIDERIVRSLRRPEDPALPRGPWWLAETARDVTSLGGFPVLSFLTVAVCGFLLVARRYRTSLFVLSSIVGGWILNALLKNLFHRPRPSVVPHLTETLSTSFPSGHAMLSAITYLTLGALLAQFAEHRRVKVYLLTVALILSVLVGCTRVYLGVHYPTDVLGGWVAGLAWALFVTVAARFVRRRSPALREEAQRPVE